MKMREPPRRHVVPNDLELLDCLAKGWKRAEIAAKCGRPLGALQMQITRVRERMGAKTSEHMIALFLQHGSAAFKNGYWVLPPMPAPIEVPQAA